MDPANAAERRAELYGLLGELPARDRPIAATVVDREEREGYTLERLVLDLNGLEPVPAYVVLARQATADLRETAFLAGLLGGLVFAGLGCWEVVRRDVA